MTATVFLVIEEGYFLGTEEEAKGLVLVQTGDGSFRRISGEDLARLEAEYPGFVRRHRDQLG